MNIIENAEKECAVLGSLFQGIVNEMKVCTYELLSAKRRKSWMCDTKYIYM